MPQRSDSACLRHHIVHSADGWDHPRMDRNSYVYMLASHRYGTLYLGVTGDLIRRVWEHRAACIDSFTRRHGIKLLVWYEVHEDIREAITREKQIKKWNRDWKVNLIQEMNPAWRDLYLDFTA
jgi:putative endonuclease